MFKMGQWHSGRQSGDVAAQSAVDESRVHEHRIQDQVRRLRTGKAALPVPGFQR